MKSSLKNRATFVAVVSIALVIAIGALAGRTANAATPTVGLKTAATYSILAGTPSITNVGAGTLVNRDVGIHPAAAVIGFLPGQIGGATHAGDAAALQAKSDLVDAYIDAASRPVTATFGTLGGRTLVSGVYNSGPPVLDLTGTLTLDGQNDPSGVWIFQATSSLITAAASKVSLTNNANPCNVFWQVTSSATLGAGSSFVGTILALTDVTLAAGVTVDGRTLARNGTVTLINDTYKSSACSSAPAGAGAGAGGGGTELFDKPDAKAPPAARAPAVVIPPGQIGGPVAPVTTAPVSNLVPAPAPVVAGAVAGPVSVLPSTSTDRRVDPLAILGIALAGIGILLLLQRSVRGTGTSPSI